MGTPSNRRFEQVVADHFTALNAYAQSVTAYSWLAEEAVQETLIRAWRYWPSFRGDSSPLTWLITICRRVVIDMASQVHHHQPLSESVESVIHLRNDASVRNTHIHELIADLPLPQREVVVLCLVLGFDYEETAQLLEIPIGTVRSRLSRARETLADQMSEALRRAQ